MSRVDHRLLRLVSTSLDRPRATLLSILLLVVLAGAGLPRSTLRTDGTALVPSHHPAVSIDREIDEQFGLRESFVVLVESSRPDGIYQPSAAHALAELSRRLVALPEIEDRAVVSLATETSDRTYPRQLRFRPFLDPLPESAADFERLRSDLEAADLPLGTLISRDGSTAAVLVGIPPGASQDRIALYETIRATAAPLASDSLRISVVGAPAAEALLGRHILDDLIRWLPLVVLCMALVLLLVFRRLRLVLLAGAEIVAALTFTFGLMAWCGHPIYLTTAFLPVLLVAVGLADEIHVFWRYQTGGRAATTPRAATDRERVEDTFTDLARPLFLTTATTAAGFATFALSPIPAIRSFGLFAVVGIVFSWFFTCTAVPAALSLWPTPPAASGTTDDRHVPSRVVSGMGWSRLVDHPLPLFGAACLLSTLAAFGIARLEVGDRWTDGFAPESPLRTATERADQVLAGTHVLHIRLQFPPTEVPASSGAADPATLEQPTLEQPIFGPLAQPEVLDRIGAFEDQLRKQPHVGEVLGPRSHLAAVAYLFGKRQVERGSLPTDPADLQQTIVAFDLGRGRDRRREVFDDAMEQGVVTVFLRGVGSREVEDLIQAAQSAFHQELEPLGAKLDFGGDVAVSRAMVPAVVRGQVVSLLFAPLACFLMIFLTTRSLTTAALAVGPVLIAVGWTFGFLGWSGWPLGVATSMFSAMVLGTAPDFAIHLLHAWQRQRASGSLHAAHRALREAGPAIAIDALALGLGFSALAASQVPANARLGSLVLVALGLGCVCTLLGLGGVLQAIDRRRPSRP